jgi:hypothetical protein
MMPMSSNRKVELLAEPLLRFAHGQAEAHPKDGLMLYGPVGDTSKRGTLNFGVIGTKSGINLLQQWAATVTGYIPPHREGVAHHSAFPGFEAVFGLQWPETPISTIVLDEREIANAIRITNPHEAIKSTTDIYAEAIEQYLNNDADVSPDFWYVVIPDEVYKWGRPKSRPPMSERKAGKAKMRTRDARRFLSAPSMLEEDNWEAELQLYDLNFHNQLKARLLRKAVVQIIKEKTLLEASDLTLDPKNRSTQDPATIAWNLCTTSYYKSVGPPWRLNDIREGVCYIGIVFKKDSSDPNLGNACCGAQLFLRSGEGLVFKGTVGDWYSDKLKQFHLPQVKAKELIQAAIKAYRDIHDEPPKEVFIHGRSRFNSAEWSGFNEALTDDIKLAAIRIRPTDELKLYRLAKQPPLRGTFMRIHDRMAYLWTKGYVPRFGTYPGFETPNPVAVTIDYGDAEIEQVLHDILALTKVNFNGCTFADGLPVTLKFADAIGEILTAAPNVVDGPQPFKYYI